MVSSDHAHTMTVAGYPSRGNDILGTVDTATGLDGKPYTTISYANGKAHSIGLDGTRVDVTLQNEFNTRKYLISINRPLQHIGIINKYLFSLSSAISSGPTKWPRMARIFVPIGTYSSRLDAYNIFVC